MVGPISAIETSDDQLRSVFGINVEGVPDQLGPDLAQHPGLRERLAVGAEQTVGRRTRHRDSPALTQ